MLARRGDTLCGEARLEGHLKGIIPLVGAVSPARALCVLGRAAVADTQKRSSRNPPQRGWPLLCVPHSQRKGPLPRIGVPKPGAFLSPCWHGNGLSS